MVNEAGLFLIGLGVGSYVNMSLAALPKPINYILPFFGLIVILIGVLLMVKK